MGAQPLTLEELEARATQLKQNDWPVSKWITFAQELLQAGYQVSLYEAQRTFSKYLTVSKPKSGKRPVRIRFSNHAPIPERELRGDCDFFVGKVNNGPWQTTQQARIWVDRYFKPD